MSGLAMERTGASALLRWLPSTTAIFAFALGGVLFSITVTKGVQDPDYFWHVKTGELIATQGILASDPFSFTWGGQPWTLHEWVSELVMFWLVDAFGRLGALFVFALFPAAIFGTLAFVLARRGVRTLAFALPAVLAALVVTPYVTLRPQAVSWLMLALLTGFLLELRPDRPRRVLLLVPFFVLWANLHGVYVIGLGVVGVYSLFTLIGRTPMAPNRGWMIGTLAGCIGASMLTPAGPIGILYPFRYVDAGDWGLANIQEWQSPSFHEPAHWALLGVIVAVGLNAGRATPGWLVMLSWVGIAMALMALRNAPIAAIFAMPTLALGLEARLRDRLPERKRVLKPRVAATRRIMELATALTIVLGAAVVLVPPAAGRGIDDNIARRFPVDGVDRLLALNPDARVLADYGWGGYVIWRMYDSGGRVFVDGRNDMYDQQILEDYTAIREAESGWQELVHRYRVEAILLPPRAALTKGAAESEGWCEAYRDEGEVLLMSVCES